jgi:porphobilinogen synthase
MMPLPPFPTSRLRRLRTTAALRRLVADVAARPSDLVLPMFVREGIDAPVEIASMPGVLQHTLDSLVKAAEEAVTAGVGGLMIFGVPARRDAVG